MIPFERGSSKNKRFRRFREINFPQIFGFLKSEGIERSERFWWLKQFSLITILRQTINFILFRGRHDNLRRIPSGENLNQAL